MSTLKLVLVALITSGCAHTISVESSPPGASVLVDGVPAGRTPMALAEKTGRDDLVSIEVERDGRTAHFAYQKTGVSTDAVIGATAASCGMCAVGVGGLVGLVVLIPTLVFVATAPQVAIPVIIAAYAAYVIGVMLVGYAPYALVVGIGEGGRKGPERIHVDFSKGTPVVTTTPDGMSTPLVGRSRSRPPLQRY